MEEVVKVRPEDQIYSCGDNFDRALNCTLVWELIQKYNVKSVLGNHEAKFLRYFDAKKKGSQGFLPPHYHYVINKLWENGINPSTFEEYLRSLPLLIVDEEKKFVVAHAGIDLADSTKPNESMNVYGKMRDEREVTWWDHYKDDYDIFYGHLSQMGFAPRIRYKSIGLDTGVSSGGPCIAYCVEEKKFYTYRSGINWFKQFKEMNNEKTKYCKF